MSNLAFAHGRAISDFQAGRTLDDNPYTEGTPQYKAWESEMRHLREQSKVVKIYELASPRVISLVS